MKNPFYWDTKKMSSFDKECAWESTKAMRKLGRERFDELFEVKFNGKTTLIVPRDLKKVTLHDLSLLWCDDVRFARGFHKKKNDTWYVTGQYDDKHS